MAKHKVLWIDDERYSLQEYIDALELTKGDENKHLWHIDFCNDVGKAIKILCVENKHYDVIILDILLPHGEDMDDLPDDFAKKIPSEVNVERMGLALLGVLQNHIDAKPHVIIFTCIGANDVFEKLYEYKCVHKIIQKPATTDLLEQSLLEIVSCD
ncbi:MAG: hypothetical protein GY845_20710 [Planctomycetes bacterium]|nr:hypothetical protein [Planctomycetota bacterium]